MQRQPKMTMGWSNWFEQAQIIHLHSVKLLTEGDPSNESLHKKNLLNQIFCQRHPNLRENAIFWVCTDGKNIKFILHDKLSDLEEYVKPLIFFSSENLTTK